ncbi:Ribosomal RNA small subunit methyltransferase I [Linum perenne]
MPVLRLSTMATSLAAGLSWRSAPHYFLRVAPRMNRETAYSYSRKTVLSFCTNSQVNSELIDSIPVDSKKRSPLSPGLYLVGTPIGNLEDITFRALRVLKSADVILSEDTRHSGKLLHCYDIKTPLLSYHKFNESQREQTVLNRLRQGEIVALISDAGMPGISDPGTALVSIVLLPVAIFYPPWKESKAVILLLDGRGPKLDSVFLSKKYDFLNAQLCIYVYVTWLLTSHPV